MIDFKKMDDKDFIFVNQRFTKDEENAFSAFLKNRQRKNKSVSKRLSILEKVAVL
jgi:hypothetical protein